MKKEFIEYLSEDMVGIESSINVVGLEESILTSISQKLSSYVQKINDKINTRTYGLKELLYSIGTINDIKKIKKIRSKKDKIIATPFQEVEDIQIPTMVGLKVPLITVSNRLITYFKDLKKESIKNLDELDTIISEFLSSEDFRKSFRKPSRKIEEINKIYNIELQSDIKNMFDLEDKTEIASLNKLVRSNNELKENIELLYKINEEFTDKDLIKLNKKIDVIKKKIDMLVQMLEVSDITITKEALESLTLTLNTLANYVTNISNMYYLHIKNMEITFKIVEQYETK